MDIRQEILNQYHVDIDETNILKLYKIKDRNMPSNEISKQIDAMGNKWNTTVQNGTNAAIVAKAQAHVEHHNVYAAILKNPRLREALFDYYSSDKKKEKKVKTDQNELALANQYFSVVSTSKSVTNGDLEFFINYYGIRHQSSIRQEIGSKYIHSRFKGAEKDASKFLFKSKKKEDSENEQEEENKRSSHFISHLFTRDTVMNLKKCINNYNEMEDPQTVLHYPFPKQENVNVYLHTLIDGRLAGTNLTFETINREQMLDLISKEREYASKIRQEQGFESLVKYINVLNNFRNCLKSNDVRDNFTNFKMMLKYPDLTPYMYTFVEMKNETMDAFYKVADHDYHFQNKDNFMIHYFVPMYSNFNIDVRPISQLMKQVEQAVNLNKIISNLDQRIGFNEDTVSAGVKFIHYLAYLPVYIIYFFIALIRLVISYLNKYAVVVGGLIFAAFLFAYRHDIFFAQRSDYPAAVFMAGIFLTVAVFLAMFLSAATVSVNKRTDWIGIERTFKEKIFYHLKESTIIESSKGGFILKKIPFIIANIGGVLAVSAIIYAIMINIK